MSALPALAKTFRSFKDLEMHYQEVSVWPTHLDRADLSLAAG